MLPPAYTDVIRIGVDDWAQRKGSKYGSIIIDLDQSIVIDLLADREQDSFGIWLEHHRAVELASLCQPYMQKSRSGDSKEAGLRFMTIIAISVTDTEGSGQKAASSKRERSLKMKGPLSYL